MLLHRLMLFLLLPGIYILAALIWQPLLAPRFQRAAIVPLVATAGGLAISLILISLPSPQTVTLIRWTPTQTLGGDLLLHADHLTLLFVALITLVAFAAMLADTTTDTQHNPTVVTGALLLTGAAVTFVLAGNLLTLILSWLLMDLATLAAVVYVRGLAMMPVRVQALALNYIGGLLVFIAGVISLGQRAEVVGLTWTPGATADLPVVMLTIAAFLRLGAYPFHRNVPDAGAIPLAAWLRLVPLAGGAYLLSRAASLAGGAPIQGEAWVMVTGLSALMGAILAWLAATRENALRWLAVYAASSVLLSLGPGLAEITILVVLGGVALVLALGALFLSEPLDRRSLSPTARVWVSAIRALAILTLWGFPLTLGFIFRWGVYRSNLEGNATSALVWSAIAATFAAAPLWGLALALLRPRSGHIGASGTTQDPIAHLLGLTLLGLPLLILGIQPQLIVPALDAASGTDAGLYLNSVLRGASVTTRLQIAMALLLPWLIGLGLGRLRSLAPADSPLLDNLRSQLALDWLYQRRWRPVSFGYQMLRSATSLGEGERYVGLLAVFAIIVALALLMQP